MSFDNIFGTSNKSKNTSSSRPERYSDLPSRPAPQEPDFSPAEPWFVTPEEPKNSKFSSKAVVKRIVSIGFPIVGLAILGIIIAAVIRYVVGIYA